MTGSEPEPHTPRSTLRDRLRVFAHPEVQPDPGARFRDDVRYWRTLGGERKRPWAADELRALHKRHAWRRRRKPLG